MDYMLFANVIKSVFTIKKFGDYRTEFTTFMKFIKFWRKLFLIWPEGPLMGILGRKILAID